MFKKFASALLCSSLMIQGAGLPVFAQEEPPLQENEPVSIVHEGTVGTASWTIDSNGVLTVGEGEYTPVDDSHHILSLSDAGFDETEPGASEDTAEIVDWPWIEYLSEITRVDGRAHFKIKGSLEYAFHSKISYLDEPGAPITSMDLSGWDTSEVTCMSTVFANLPLTTLDLSGWDTSSVTDMSGMFLRCTSLTSLNLEGWDTTSLTKGNHLKFTRD